MEKKYRYLIAGAAVAIIIVSVCIAHYSVDTFRDRFQEQYEEAREGHPGQIEVQFPEQREVIRRMLEFASLEGEAAEQAQGGPKLYGHLPTPVVLRTYPLPHIQQGSYAIPE